MGVRCRWLSDVSYDGDAVVAEKRDLVPKQEMLLSLSLMVLS